MKARIRGTNIELEVQPFYDETGYFAGFKNDYEYYRAADLVFPDTPDWDKTDWSSFRREAAKDSLCALLQDARISYSLSYEWYCQRALEIADELIKQLKEK